MKAALIASKLDYAYCAVQDRRVALEEADDSGAERRRRHRPAREAVALVAEEVKAPSSEEPPVGGRTSQPLPGLPPRTVRVQS